jgi:tRNA(Ile)-lysidine synthase
LPGALAAVHLDHAIHPDSAAWCARCRSLCDSLGVPFVSRRLRLAPARGKGLEAAAREARYGELAALLAPGDLLATAHNLDDQAETLLLAMLRGSGVHGLAAMPFAAPLGPGRLIRPLLDWPRAALHAYCLAQGLDWIEDPSNASLAHDRNYLRQLVLPAIRARWPRAATTLARSAAHCAEAAGLIDGWAESQLPGLAGGRPGTLSCRLLLGLDPAEARAVLRLWVRRLGLPLPDRTRLGRIQGEVLSARPDSSPLVDWPGAEVRRYRDDLHAILPLPAPPPPGLKLPWDGCRTLGLPEPLGRLEPEPDPDRARGQTDPAAAATYSIRFGLSGLACRLPGRGGTRSLKDLFQESGIPPWLRPHWPLVLLDDRLAALPGLCRCELPGGALGPTVHWLGDPWTHLGLKPHPGQAQPRRLGPGPGAS